MTLVVARKISDSILIISDTSSFDIGSTSSYSLSLTQKIVPYSDCVMAFSGIIDITHELFAFNEIENPCFVDVSGLAIELSKRYYGHLDFIIAEKDKCNLWYISEGVAELRQVAHLGSTKAFSRFQSEMTRGVDHSLHSASAQLNIVRIPDGAPEGFAEQYVRSVGALRRMLLQKNDDIGGFAVPFHLFENGRNGFGFYVSAYSGRQRRESEAVSWKAVDLGFDDQEFGSFGLSFTGSASGYRITIPQILWEREWHSPFVAKISPPVSPFLIRGASKP